MNNKYDISNYEILFNAVLSLKTPEECFDFFRDLCTVTELNTLSQRIVVAKMLNEKKVYNDIIKETGASTATISRVNRSLLYGYGSYDKIFNNSDNE